MKVENLSIDSILPYWRNPRKNEAAIEAVKESINQFGFNSPIIVDKKMVIISGHTRFKAAKELGLTTVPVYIASHLTDIKAKEYRVIDNKTSELAKWDMNLLLPELREFENLEDFTSFFPELSLEEVDHGSIGSGYVQVTQQQIDDRQEKMSNQFTNASQANAKAIKYITCPHCDNSFEARYAD
jgi:site-specific DNA-methyltransferase (adenine-specific)